MFRENKIIYGDRSNDEFILINLKNSTNAIGVLIHIIVTIID